MKTTLIDDKNNKVYNKRKEAIYIYTHKQKHTRPYIYIYIYIYIYNGAIT